MATPMEKFPIQKFSLDKIPLEELADVLRGALKENFKEVSVELVECPDLTKAPFHLAGKGICGDTRIADVGGLAMLGPEPQMEHVYDLKSLASVVGLPDGCLVLGPACGPIHELGCHSEYAGNAYVSATGPASKDIVRSQTARAEPEGCRIDAVNSTEFAFIGNFFISRGQPGKVLEIKAKHRTGEKNFITCMREKLIEAYPDKFVGMGGAFIVESGKVLVHAMPSCYETPMLDPAGTSWLGFYEFEGPILFLNEFVNRHPGPPLHLRVEHSHGYKITDESGKAIAHEGGHYHEDVTPQEASYIGYFNRADFLFRIDQQLNSNPPN